MPVSMTESFIQIRRAPLLQYYVAVLLAMLALTGLLDLFLSDEVERAVNLHHIIAGLGVIAFAAYGRVALTPLPITGFFAALLVVSAIAAIEHGVHPMLLNAVYCFYLCLLGLLSARILGRQLLLSALRLSAWLILFAITVKNIFYLHDIRDTLSTLQDRVFIPSVVAGGLNMEATFALFAAVFLRGTRSYWPAFIYAIFLAILYSSRAPLLGGALLFAYEIIAPSKGASVLFKQLRIAALILGGIAIALTLFASPITQFALSRFQDIGYEPGSEGRLVLWQTAPEVFLKNPMGVGAGNAIPDIEAALGHDVQEDNLHDIYLQILVDLGVVGFAAYAWMIYGAARRGMGDKGHNPMWIAIGLYFLMGVLQFRAYDPFMFFWLGLAWHSAPPEDAGA